MKTSCYCVYCPRHPKFEQRHDLGQPVTGYTVGNLIWKSEYDDHKAEVNCLLPKSQAFNEYDLDYEDFKYPVTAYGDGQSETGFYNQANLTLYATCANEIYSA